MDQVNVTAGVAADEKTVFEKHYAEVLPELMALRAESVAAVNLDIPSVVATMLGAHPEIVAAVAEPGQALPGIDVEKVKRLDAYAMALSHAQTLYLVALKPPDELQPLVEEGTSLREVLLTDATALVQRGLMNGARLKDLRGPSGYKNLAVDLQILAALFRESLAQIQGKAATTRAEIARADHLAAEILRAVGLKEQGTALIASTTDVRNRAFTVATGLYDQIRRAVIYLRWNEDDADSIAPSLFARSGRKRETAGDETIPGVGVPTTGGPGSADPAAAQGASKAGGVGGDPFMG